MASSVDPHDEYHREPRDPDTHYADEYPEEPIHSSNGPHDLGRDRDRDADDDRKHRDRGRGHSDLEREELDDDPHAGRRGGVGAHYPSDHHDQDQRAQTVHGHPPEAESHVREDGDHVDDEVVDTRDPDDDPMGGGGRTGGGGGGALGAASRGPPDISETVSLLVLNLSFRTTPGDLRSLFAHYGRLADVYIPKNRETGDSRGFAFVRYYNKEDAERAIDGMHNKSIDNRDVQVQFARYGRQPIGQTGSGGGGGRGRGAPGGQRGGGYGNSYGGGYGGGGGSGYGSGSSRQDNRDRYNDHHSDRYGGGGDRYGIGGDRYGGGSGDRYGSGGPRSSGGDRYGHDRGYDRHGYGDRGNGGAGYDRYGGNGGRGGGRGSYEGYRGGNSDYRRESMSDRSYGGRDSGSYGGGSHARGGSNYGRGHGRDGHINGGEDYANGNGPAGAHLSDGLGSDGAVLGRHPRSPSPRRGRSSGGSRSPSPKRYRGTPPRSRSPDAYASSRT